MDLLSSIRKTGSRGGVNFSWDDVSTSQHRENYLGHSLMAPVGRWQKGRDLNWYAKADDENASPNETAEERKIRERKEEIRKIKEAEEDALAKALGLPVTPRGNGEGTGANGISVGEIKRVINETENGDDEIEEVGRGKGFGQFVGKTGDDDAAEAVPEPERGGLLPKASDGGGRGSEGRTRRQGREDRSRSRSRERRRRRHRHRSRSGQRHRRRSRSADNHRYRSRSRESDNHRRRETKREGRGDREGREGREGRGDRSRSPDRRERRYRSKSPDRHRTGRYDRPVHRDSNREPRRNRSREFRIQGDRGDRDLDRGR